MLWVTFAWGSCFLAISIGLQDAPLLWLAALRALIAGAALVLACSIRRTLYPRDGRTWLLIAALGVVNVALAYAAMFGGIIGLSTGAASVLANVQPLLIVLPAWWLYRQTPSRTTVAAMLLGLAGLLLIAIPTGFGTGAWLPLTASAAVTAGTLIARAVHADPLIVAAWQLLVGGAILALVATIVEGPPTIDWTPGFVIVLLYMALVGTAATTVAWFAEVQHARLDILTTWTLLVPVFGITLSVILLQEPQSPWSWIGIAAVVASMIILVVRTSRRRRPSTPPPDDRSRQYEDRQAGE
jgi:probable blue pigment (indigoidine) exporter